MNLILNHQNTIFSLLVQNYMCSCRIDLLFLAYVFCIGLFVTSVMKVLFWSFGCFRLSLRLGGPKGPIRTSLLIFHFHFIFSNLEIKF